MFYVYIYTCIYTCLPHTNIKYTYTALYCLIIPVLLRRYSEGLCRPCKAFTGSLGMFQEIIIARIDELVSRNTDNLNLSNSFNRGNKYLFHRLILVDAVNTNFPRSTYSLFYITHAEFILPILLLLVP